MNLKKFAFPCRFCFPLTLTVFLGLLSCTVPVFSLEKIDRQSVVSRHFIQSLDPNLEIPLGNGEFCFNVDFTGLQTTRGNTMAHWGWHSNPLPEGFTKADVPETGTLQQGRNTFKGDHSFPPEKQALRQWLRDNPHRADLARIRLFRPDGNAVTPQEIRPISRKMDLWTGLHTAEFELDGETVRVETFVSMDADLLASRVKSSLLAEGKLLVSVEFPYPTIQMTRWSGEFGPNSRHETRVLPGNSTRNAQILRKVDDFEYLVSLQCGENSAFQIDPDSHALTISTDGELCEFFCAFHDGWPKIEARKQVFETLRAETARKWETYWLSGAAVDLSLSKDPRWKELERRIVLSQYLMRTNSAGSYPPPETGLLGTDNWRGRYHGEMIYWHLAHYSLWDRQELSDRALDCYRKNLPVARKLAAQLGYAGAQWPKCTGPEGRTAPWVGNQVLLWKQPHPMIFAELEYRNRPTAATLEKWAEILDETAKFMASYPEKDAEGVWHLAPVMPPSETGIVKDSVFDLAYWRFGLRLANTWRERMGKERVAEWDEIADHLAPLPTHPGLPENETVWLHSPDWINSYEKFNWEHPNPVGVYGMIPPTEGVDPEIARRTLRKVYETWRWDRVWGWDFPWTAMCAARVGEPEIAVDILLHESPRNVHDLRGVNANNPCPYLPGNGGLLYAIGMMAGGWDGAPEVDREKGEAPGFPRNGQWFIKAEGFKPAP
ncbi:MAG: hypothetical protein IJD43_03285 [Thermoguttaceae bacterium]|nr:hypothetical protein [Thermoguttaceae bacterium]